MELNTVLDYLHTLITSDLKDWTLNEVDAKIYLIINGYNRKDLLELQKRFHWTESEIKQLKTLHSEFQQMQFDGVLKVLNIEYEKQKESIAHTI